MKAPENPYAFPAPDDDRPSDGYGMTLRDWFAGQALAGLAGCFRNVEPKAGETRAEAEARWSYSRADAMLAARTVSPRSTDDGGGTNG